jgi:hypothetical protein
MGQRQIRNCAQLRALLQAVIKILNYATTELATENETYKHVFFPLQSLSHRKVI